ncbi:hypothetical protein EC919_109134 [Pseudomonas graminis]|uniref:hypothetical protein n=1 Tax=Pseudomonas graminis TaxID=158627 RepID=UPI00105B8C6C|nr:hypothetical protein [Pseudomonas graminis]TDV48190.1 hypothetical protein EC919_109134 [Pseudomonas graminis]
MIASDSISSVLATNTIKTVAKTASVAAVSADTKDVSPATRDVDSATLSTFSRQLNDSAARAESRDNRLDSKQLASLAKDVIEKLTGSSYYGDKAVHDAETPDTEDPELLERAIQATRFTNGSGTNPFSGMSLKQLTLIVYDEAGAYTLNERKAAYSEKYDQEEVWKRAICRRYVDEYNETGKSTQTLFMMLAHYNELPPIEKAQYPDNYAANLASGDSAVLEALNVSHASTDSSRINV